MNKQQLYTFGGALLASTALSGAANAITFGQITNAGAAGGAHNLSTSSFSIANTLFSTTASTANGVTISNGGRQIGARFSNTYSSQTAANVGFSVEIVPTGAEFTSGTPVLGNVRLLYQSAGSSTAIGSVGAATLCSGATGFSASFIINGCTAANTTAGGTNNVTSLNLVGLVFSGVTFTNASGLANVGSTVTLTGRVYNTATLTNFEATVTNTIMTSAAPLTTALAASANVVASATSTPTAFTSLSTNNGGNTGGFTMDLVSLSMTGTGALMADLSHIASPSSVIGSATITVQSAILSSGAVSRINLLNAGGAVITTTATVANFSGGSITFTIPDADVAMPNTGNGSITVRAIFNGTTVIPVTAAGTASVAFATDTQNGGQPVPTVTGTTASISQGGFRAEVNTFNSSSNAPYSSYLRIHNSGAVAGTVTITVRADDHAAGGVVGSSFTTAAIQPNGTMQLSSADVEGSATSTKLPSGGANIPTASRVGSYTLSITGPIVGYVQHFLFDGTNLADLSSFRNGGNTNNVP